MLGEEGGDEGCLIGGRGSESTARGRQGGVQCEGYLQQVSLSIGSLLRTALHRVSVRRSLLEVSQLPSAAGSCIAHAGPPLPMVQACSARPLPSIPRKNRLTDKRQRLIQSVSA